MLLCLFWFVFDENSAKQNKSEPHNPLDFYLLHSVECSTDDLRSEDEHSSDSRPIVVVRVEFQFVEHVISQQKQCNTYAYVVVRMAAIEEMSSDGCGSKPEHPCQYRIQ